MKLSEFVRDLQQLAGDTDPEVVVVDSAGQEWKLDPDADDFGFQVTRGDNELCIELSA